MPAANKHFVRFISATARDVGSIYIVTPDFNPVVAIANVTASTNGLKSVVTILTEAMPLVEIKCPLPITTSRGSLA